MAVLTAASLGAEQQLLFDFERQGLSGDWSAQGEITVVRQPVPEFTDGGDLVPAGHGVHVDASPLGTFYTKPGKVPGNWRRFESVSLWIYRSPEEARRRPVSTIELLAYENDNRTRFWRKVELTHEGWTRVAAPLKWFRFGDGRVPRWDRVSRWAVRFRDAAEVTVDSVAVTVGDGDGASELSVADLSATAFPDTPADQARVFENAELRILTNVDELQLNILADHFAVVAERVRRDFPLVPQPAVPATLVVLATNEQYLAFHTRFAQRLNSRSAPTNSGGYTVHGVATSSWDKRWGTLRPVYTHEFVHSLLTHGTGIQNRGGDWFQEGVATYYQLQYHPQFSFSKVVKDGLDNKDRRLPLPQLLSGRPIPKSRYWQAVLVVHMLLNDETYRPRFPDLVRAFQDSGSTNIAPHLESVLKTTEEDFARDWLTYCRGKYEDRRRPGAARRGSDGMME